MTQCRSEKHIRWYATPKSGSAVRWAGYYMGIRRFECLWRPDLDPQWPWQVQDMRTLYSTSAENTEDFNRIAAILLERASGNAHQA